MTEIEKAWLACALDSEGSIVVKKCKQKNRQLQDQHDITSSTHLFSFSLVL